MKRQRWTAAEEISLNRWIQGEMTSPLFEYKVEDQAGCEIILDTQKQCVSINNAESKGEFTFADYRSGGK